jgi:hypothetical protein
MGEAGFSIIRTGGFMEESARDASRSRFLTAKFFAPILASICRAFFADRKPIYGE